MNFHLPFGKTSKVALDESSQLSIQATARKRIRFLAICILLFAGVIVAKLYQIQIVKHDFYADKAEKQYASPTSSHFERGSIYFSSRDGDKIIGAGTDKGYILAIQPKLITDEEKTYEVLSSVIQIPKEDFIKKALKKSDPYEEISRRVDPLTGEKISALKLAGISLYPDAWRTYPLGTLAPHVLGLIGYEGTKLVGKYGIEASYENLINRSNKASYSNFFAKLFSSDSNLESTTSTSGAGNNGNNSTSSVGIAGGISSDNSTAFTKNLQDVQGNIVLTIEPTVQQALEKTLGDIKSKWNSDEIGAIVMDPHTGEILAMSALPSFDPNNFKSVSDVRVFTNPLVSNRYEFGSIIKPLTMSAGIDVGAVTPSTTYFDYGTIESDGKKISNFDKKGRGQVSMQEVLSQSLNTGVAYVVNKMGNDSFSNYFYNFGLGERSGIDLPYEQKGNVENLKSPRDVEHITASFGQGIALTPIGATRALSALANGGTLVTPHVGKSVDYINGDSETIKYTDERIVVKPESAKLVTDMLVKAFDTALIGGSLKMEHWSIAAKTGTAQIADNVNGGYFENKYLHSFVGYFPAKSPKFIVFMYHVNPKGAGYASDTLAHPFADLAKFLITYYHVPPDR